MKRFLKDILRTAISVCLFLASGCCLPMLAQGWELSGGPGRVLSVDPYLDVIRTPMKYVRIGYLYQTHTTETSGFARDYGFPQFEYGIALMDYNRVRVTDTDLNTPWAPSRLGTSVAAYASFRRTVIRKPCGFSLSYSLTNGIALSNHTWNRESNPENELIGRRLSLYVGLGVYAAWQFRHWQIHAGPEFLHLSNGALARPNKGVNSLGLTVGANYLFDPLPSASNTKMPRKPFAEQGFILGLTHRTGLKTSLGEWLVDKQHLLNGSPLPYDSYRLFVSQAVTADLLYRYDRRFASGVGLDMLYEPYLGRIEAQNPERPRNISKFSWGLSLRHEAYYKRLGLTMALGYYLSRPFKKWAVTDEEYGYYERIGVSYRLPLLRDNLLLGYDINAHRTKAYSTEIFLRWELKL